MPKNHRLMFESRKIFAAVLAVLFLTGSHPVPPEPGAGPIPPQSVEHPMPKNCGKRAAVVADLNANYAERPKSVGIADNGTVLEVLTAKSGTWSILMTLPDGITCLIWFGEYWQDLGPQDGETAL